MFRFSLCVSPPEMATFPVQGNRSDPPSDDLKPFNQWIKGSVPDISNILTALIAKQLQQVGIIMLYFFFYSVLLSLIFIL